MVYWITILIILEGLVIILQNVGIIPFLWSNLYKIGYAGFLSGTFGPNKIVMGMSMLISLIFLIGLSGETKLRTNKTLMIIGIGIAVICILLSGSRTTYVGTLVFLTYFAFTKTGKFIIIGILGTILTFILLMSSPVIKERISATLEDRVTYAIESPEDVKNLEEANEVYDELSAGRVELHWKYVQYLLENPLVIPFGRGFNNRIGVGPSAHNQYLSFISELGIMGLILFVRWLLSFIIIPKKRAPGLQLALNGIVLSMMVTLYFGEHLYIYRPLFGILGFFMLICGFLAIPLRKIKVDEKP